MQTPSVNPKFYTFSEVAAMFRVKPITIQRWAKREKLRSIKISNRVLIPAAAIKELEKGSRQK